ncbi:hypothetical protein Nepgr_023378 [Nepenthes gracilis]|uniref:NPH3 domain-containing protein n=1 Tax=Nepenthes gracilis TaxID=150966 RepID=A0AAD3T2R2_NEPGR|nr:hypothetical protein Nepgr_023378 [Nepenthes gracilis]
MLQAIAPRNLMAVRDQVLVDLIDPCQFNQTKLLQLLTTTMKDGLPASGLELNDAVQSKDKLEAVSVSEVNATARLSSLPSEKSALPISFLCSLLQCAIFLKASSSCKNELEKRISAILELVTVNDLLVLSFTYDGEGLFDLESVRRIISGTVAKERNVDVFNGGNFKEVYSTAIQQVAKTVEAYLGEIATYSDLSISKEDAVSVSRLCSYGVLLIGKAIMHESYYVGQCQCLHFLNMSL